MASTGGTKAVILFASVGSGIVIFGCLIGVAVLFNDINNLYDEIMTDMGEFKMYANDAWKEMVYVQGKIPAGEDDATTDKSTFSALIGRVKRQYNQNPSAGVYGGSRGGSSGGYGGGSSQCSKLLL
uniref:Nematode cuticle collagen N-terminal domain-containing protein n=1 Tax=Panagrolaimus sp. ES5 TaxID=591445 RepID=A0AC34GG43_9BILA